MVTFIWLIVGSGNRLLSPFNIPVDYAKYFSVAILVAFDSVIGGLELIRKKALTVQSFKRFCKYFDGYAVSLYRGSIGVDLYLAAIVAFSTRIFQNIIIIRRHFINKHYKDEKIKKFILVLVKKE